MPSEGVFCKILAPITAYHLHWHGTGTTFLRLHPSSKGPKNPPKNGSFVKDLSPKISLKSLPEILALRKNGRVLKNFGAKVTLYVFLLNVFSMLFSRFYRGLVVLHLKNGAFRKKNTNDTGIVLKIIRFWFPVPGPEVEGPCRGSWLDYIGDEKLPSYIGIISQAMK